LAPTIWNSFEEMKKKSGLDDGCKIYKIIKDKFILKNYF
jgi:hypothetical protein